MLTISYMMQTNLCKLSAAFAQPIGGCLKALKEGMGSTDPQVAIRVADWLAMHINNHDFIWSWHRWENVLQLPPYHPIRWNMSWCEQSALYTACAEGCIAVTYICWPLAHHRLHRCWQRFQ